MLPTLIGTTIEIRDVIGSGAAAPRRPSRRRAGRPERAVTDLGHTRRLPSLREAIAKPSRRRGSRAPASAGRSTRDRPVRLRPRPSGPEQPPAASRPPAGDVAVGARRHRGREGLGQRRLRPVDHDEPGVPAPERDLVAVVGVGPPVGHLAAVVGEVPEADHPRDRLPAVLAHPLPGLEAAVRLGRRVGGRVDGRRVPAASDGGPTSVSLKT